MYDTLASAQPVVASGAVYFVTGAGIFGNDGKVYKWNAITGQSVWDPVPRTGDDLYGPAVADGIVYVQDNQHGVFAFRDNGSSTTAVWHAQPGTRLDSKSAPAVANGLVYIGEGDNHIYALQAQDGTVAWSYATEDYVDASPVVAGGTVYVGPVHCGGGNCAYALNAITGQLQWQINVGNGPGGSLLVRDGTLYGTVTGQGLYAVNAQSGALVWHLAIGTDGDLLADERALYVTSATDAAGDLACISRNDHTMQWHRHTSHTRYTLLSVSGGLLFVGEWHTDSGATYIRALRTSDGAERWTLELEAPQPTPTPGQ